MTRDHDSGHGDDTECAWQVQTIQGAARWKEEKEREKEKARDDPTGSEEHSLVMNKREILNGGKKKTQPSGPKERKARSACQKAMMASKRVVFAHYQPDKGASKDFLQKQRQRKGSERKKQRRNLSSIRIVSLRNTQ